MHSRTAFDIEHFAADCRTALAERGSQAIRDVVSRAVAEPAAILRTLGEPSRAAAGVVYRTPDLTILNVVWGPRPWTLPHNHNHRAIIGMYGGGEDNIFWRRLPRDAKGRVEAAGAESLRQGSVAVLGRDIIHSVTNPLGKLSMALHVYEPDRKRFGNGRGSLGVRMQGSVFSRLTGLVSQEIRWLCNKTSDSPWLGTRPIERNMR